VNADLVLVHGFCSSPTTWPRLVACRSCRPFNRRKLRFMVRRLLAKKRPIEP
jgi:hypothetical protein